MPMKRHLLIGTATVAVAAAFAVPVGPAQAQATATVRVIHGIGPDDNPVDIYVDDQLTLTAASFEDQALVGAVDAGVHNVKLCNAVPVPPTTLTEGCDGGSVGPNPGVDLTLVAGTSVTWLAVWSPVDPIGRPSVVQVSHTVTCITSGNARVSASNQAAFVDPVSVAIAGVPSLPDLAAGQTAFLINDVPAFTAATVVLSDGDANELETDDNVEFPANNLTTVYAVGNPQIEGGDVEMIDESIPLDVCVAPTTTVSVAPTTASTSASTTSSTPIVVVNPRFTG